jgi:chemotaxis protein CheD
MRRVSIVQGEHAVVSEPHVVLSTVLGSCIAVCLQDPVARIGGMNHFLLSEPSTGADVGPTELQRYGIHAMEVLINGLMAKGASRERLRAHIYGGANVVAGLGKIGSHNAAFARRFCRTEGISIAHEDVGGNCARRVEFLPHEGKSRCTRVSQAPARVAAPKPVPAPARSGELELF